LAHSDEERGSPVRPDDRVVEARAPGELLIDRPGERRGVAVVDAPERPEIRVARA